MNKAVLLTLGILIIFACKKTEDDPQNDFDFGKNRFTTEVNGDSREYFVHVPQNYDKTDPIPIVFMLHGTSGDGEKFYNISGWKELGEKEEILTVYPSSWSYCIIEDGETKNTTKWNMYPGAFEFCNGQTPRDDIKFLRQALTEIKTRFTVDEKRVYLVGFSAGGQMAFRCGVEMSDVLAAVVGSAASTPGDSTFVPLRNLPIIFQLGNEDDRYFSSPAPLSGLDYALNNIPVFQRIVNSHITTFDYSSNYRITGDTNSVVIATYPPIPATDNREFSVSIIKDMGHLYPNGVNHWMKGAEKNWEWFKQYTLP
ncbi:MAG: alpha/beta hydrolase [Saprospiraceae bacterium]|nr:alpha/beta hydrolase [Saprospiraceae bacterium]